MVNQFQNKDRRKDLRVPVRLRVDETARTLSFYFSCDVSRSGIFLETKLPLENGQRVFLEFSLPDGGDTMRTWGQTVWTRRSEAGGGGRSGMGIVFEKLSDDDARRLEAFIDSVQ